MKFRRITNIVRTMSIFRYLLFFFQILCCMWTHKGSKIYDKLRYERFYFTSPCYNTFWSIIEFACRYCSIRSKSSGSNRRTFLMSSGFFLIEINIWSPYYYLFITYIAYHCWFLSPSFHLFSAWRCGDGDDGNDDGDYIYTRRTIIVWFPTKRFSQKEIWASSFKKNKRFIRKTLNKHRIVGLSAMYN